MYKVPKRVTKAVIDVQVGETIGIGSYWYRVARKESNTFGDQILTLQPDADHRCPVKLIMPGHLLVTTHFSEPVIYEFED